MTINRPMKTNVGLKILKREIPLAFNATSSKLSDKFPNVINPATIMVKGNAIGTKSANDKKISFTMTKAGIPLPTSSSMYFQRNCIKNRNKLNTNVTKNGPMKERNTSTSIFLSLNGDFIQVQRYHF